MPDDNWDGRTYYGRSQLKPAPFDTALVGSYVFLAGLSGAAQLLAALIDAGHARGGRRAVRRGRYLAMLAPTVGSVCLVLDLHTPRRFYNMLRVFKTTSPMSLGSWALIGFSAVSTMTAGLQFLSDRIRRPMLPRALARATQLPAAMFGAVLATYTASLLAATSSPRWAAAPRSLAVRFGAASVASAAAALSLGEQRHSRLGRDLDGIAVAALAVELAAMLAEEETEQRAGIAAPAGGAAHAAAVGRGNAAMVGSVADAAPVGSVAHAAPVGSVAHAAMVAVPLAAFMLSLLRPGHRSRLLSGAASLGVLGASLAMRLEVMRTGAASAADPSVSLRFAQPDNLPH